MTTSDYALIISLISLAIALGALIWNVWQKFIFAKPNLQVSFGLWEVMQPAGIEKLTRSGQSLLAITITNLGPGPVILFACIIKIRQSWWNPRPKLGMINPIHNDPTNPTPVSVGPFSAGLPMKIEAGEMKSFYFPYERNTFLQENVIKVGVNDTYRRNRWCSSNDVKKVYRKYNQDFHSNTAEGSDGSRLSPG